MLLVVRIFKTTVLPILLLSATCATASPPPDCGKRFIGVWRHQGGFISNTEKLEPGGRAVCSDNVACMQGSWTCRGNELYYTTSMGTSTYVLQPDGTMRYGNNIATRVGQMPKDKPVHNICGIGYGGSVRTMCVGPGGNSCECMRISTTCPYPVSVTFFVDKFKRGTDVYPGKENTSACTTRVGQRVRISTWKPFAGFPKRGQPAPEK